MRIVSVLGGPVRDISWVVAEIRLYLTRVKRSSLYVFGTVSPMFVLCFLGKGSVRRKHKAVRKTATQDDKRLKSTLQKLNCRDIPAIEEVNLFRKDGQVIHFSNPKGTVSSSIIKSCCS